MRIPDSSPDAEPTFSEDTSTGEARASRLNQPWRAAVAAGEAVVAVLLVVAAFWAWGRGIVSIPLPARYGVSDVVTRMVGGWLVLAVALATGAGLLIVDLIRQSTLAWGTGRRRKARSTAEA